MRNEEGGGMEGVCACGRTLPSHVCVEFRFARENERVCARGHATKYSLCLREKNRVGVCVRARVGELQFKSL